MDYPPTSVPPFYEKSKQGWYQGPDYDYRDQSRVVNIPKYACGPGGCGCGGGGGGGGRGCGGKCGGNGGGRTVNGGMVSKEIVPKQYISRKAFNGIKMNLKRTRILGVLLTVFSTLTVGLGIAAVLLYQYGKTAPMTWCSNPFPPSGLNLSLKPIKPAFDYIVVTAGFWGLLPMITGILTSYLTRIYGTYAKTAMYFSFFAVVAMPPVFILSLIGFLMTFGPGGATPSCEALSAVNFLVVVHAVVCFLLLFLIYFTMSRFLKKLKMDPSVDYQTLKKYYGVNRITVYDDDDDYEDFEETCCGGMCCGGYCCDMDYDSENESADTTESEDEEVEPMPPQRACPPSATGMNYSSPVAMYGHHHHHRVQPHHGLYAPKHHNHLQPHYAQHAAHHNHGGVMASYPFSNHKQFYGHAHMATRYNPQAFVCK